MGIIKGQLEYKKFQKGIKLTRKQSILAHCYQCNGQEESNADCQCQNSCPLYDFSPHSKK